MPGTRATRRRARASLWWRRAPQAEALLQEMAANGALVLDETSLDDALSMHGHMLDFKKRGAFIRLHWRRKLGRRAPNFGYRPAHIPPSRQLVELVISGIFLIGGTRLARRLIESLPSAWLARCSTPCAKPGKTCLSRRSARGWRGGV